MHHLECEDTRKLLDAFQDSELDAVTSLQVQTHLESCHACERHRLWQEELRASLCRVREATPPASRRLRRQVTAASRNPRGRPRAPRTFVWSAAAAAMVVIAFGLYVLMDLGMGANDVRPYVQTHKQWTVAGGAVDLVTSDSDAAASWFDEQLPGLAAPPGTPPGYALVGARVERIRGQPVGVLLYEHEGRRVSCFVRLGHEAATEGFDQVALRGEAFLAGRCRGHQIVSWGEADGSVVLVGELDDDSLLAFAARNAVDVPLSNSTAPLPRS